MKPVIFFDLETTGFDFEKDGIVQIAAIKVFPDGRQEEKNLLINPGFPIPEQASDVHGIKDEDVKDAPRLGQVAKAMVAWFDGCDLAGYNIANFDIPFLMEKLFQLGYDWPAADTNVVDGLKIEMLVNPRDLSSVYKRYTGEELTDAHDALADVRATMKVLGHQQSQFNLPKSAFELDEFTQGENKRVDYGGKLYEKDGETYWAFGKHKDELVTSQPGYINWVLNADFPRDLKRILQQIKKAHKI